MAKKATGGSTRAARPATRAQPLVPDDVLAALRRDAAALAAFEALPPSHQREYLAWITEAKRPETRQRRIQTALLSVTRGPRR